MEEGEGEKKKQYIKDSFFYLPQIERGRARVAMIESGWRGLIYKYTRATKRLDSSSFSFSLQIKGEKERERERKNI